MFECVQQLYGGGAFLVSSFVLESFSGNLSVFTLKPWGGFLKTYFRLQVVLAA